MSPEGIFAGLVAVASAVFAGWSAYSTSRHKAKLEENNNSVEHISRVADRLERQAVEDRQLIANYQRLVRRAWAALSRCQAGEAEMYGHVVMLHGTATRHAQALQALGKDVDLPPPLPPRPDRSVDGFDARGEEQNEILDREVKKRRRRRKGDGAGGES